MGGSAELTKTDLDDPHKHQLVHEPVNAHPEQGSSSYFQRNIRDQQGPALLRFRRLFVSCPPCRLQPDARAHVFSAFVGSTNILQGKGSFEVHDSTEYRMQRKCV